MQFQTNTKRDQVDQQPEKQGLFTPTNVAVAGAALGVGGIAIARRLAKSNRNLNTANTKLTSKLEQALQRAAKATGEQTEKKGRVPLPEKLGNRSDLTVHSDVEYKLDPKNLKTYKRMAYDTDEHGRAIPPKVIGSSIVPKNEVTTPSSRNPMLKIDATPSLEAVYGKGFADQPKRLLTPEARKQLTTRKGILIAKQQKVTRARALVDYKKGKADWEAQQKVRESAYGKKDPNAEVVPKKSPYEGLEYSDRAGRYVSPEYAKMLDEQANRHAFEAIMNMIYFEQRTEQRGKDGKFHSAQEQGPSPHNMQQAYHMPMLAKVAIGAAAIGGGMLYAKDALKRMTPAGKAGEAAAKSEARSAAASARRGRPMNAQEAREMYKTKLDLATQKEMERLNTKVTGAENAQAVAEARAREHQAKLNEINQKNAGLQAQIEKLGAERNEQAEAAQTAAQLAERKVVRGMKAERRANIEAYQGPLDEGPRASIQSPARVTGKNIEGENVVVNQRQLDLFQKEGNATKPINPDEHERMIQEVSKKIYAQQGKAAGGKDIRKTSRSVIGGTAEMTPEARTNAMGKLVNDGFNKLDVNSRLRIRSMAEHIVNARYNTILPNINTAQNLAEKGAIPKSNVAEIQSQIDTYQARREARQVQKAELDKQFKKGRRKVPQRGADGVDGGFPSNVIPGLLSRKTRSVIELIRKIDTRTQAWT